MRRTQLIILALAAVASTSQAQRGGGGRVRGEAKEDWKDVMGESKIALKLSNGDVEDMEPVKRLLDKRKDLKLTDDQQKQLKDLQAKTKETNKPLFKQLDSLRQAMRPRAGADADGDRARMTLAREAAINTVQGILVSFEAQKAEAKPILTAEQAPKAEFLTKLKQESDETIAKEMGGGRRGGRP